MLYCSLSTSSLEVSERSRESDLLGDESGSVIIWSHEKKRKRSEVCNTSKKVFQLKMFWEEGMSMFIIRLSTNYLFLSAI